MKKSTNTLAITILFLCLGGLFGYTVASAVKSSDRSNNILQTLKDNCKCEEVNQIIYAKGVQFGPNGLSTEKGEYELVDCQFEDITKEVQRIQKVLQNKVKGFDKVDLLELEFVNGNNSKTVVIKKGIIQ